MSKRIVIVIGLLVIGVVTMLGTEATAGCPGGYCICFGCLSGDQCQLEFSQGGLFTGKDVKNGLVSSDCNDRTYGGKVIAAHVTCQNPAGMLSRGKSFVGNGPGTFNAEQLLTSADIHGGVANPFVPIPASVAEFCQLTVLPESCTEANITSCYDCFKFYFNLPSECIGCSNCNWRYYAMDHDDLCVNFKVTVAGVPELNVVRRCTDPGNTNFVDCPADPTNCPFVQ
jgi:hypothetical protein